MRNTDVIQMIDGYVQEEARRMLLAVNTEEVQLAMARMDCAQDILRGVKARVALDRDIDNNAYEGVLKRLEKVNARRSVCTDAVASDQIRLACKTLRRLREPAPADTEPIDIMIFDD